MTSDLPEACIPFDEDLSALIDEELAPGREAEVRAHVDACDRCALRLQELCNVDLALAGLAQPTATPQLARELAARIAADAPPPQQTPTAPAEPARARSAPPRPRRRWRGGASLSRVAVAAGLVLAAWLLLRSGDTLTPEPQIARTQPEAPETELPVTQPEAPELPIAQTPPEPESESAPESAPGELPVEDLAMLLELRELEDLDLIANLELLETLVELERGAG